LKDDLLKKELVSNLGDSDEEEEEQEDEDDDEDEENLAAGMLESTEIIQLAGKQKIVSYYKENIFSIEDFYLFRGVS
jgi:hypothetical protein